MAQLSICEMSGLGAAETAEEVPPTRRTLAQFGARSSVGAVASARLPLRDLEHARFAELHRSLIASVRRIVGETPAFCYCGGYLASGLAVGSSCEGEALRVARPLDLDLLFGASRASPSASGIASMEDSPWAGCCTELHVTARLGTAKVGWLPLVARGQVLGVVGAIVEEKRCIEKAREDLACLESYCSTLADIFLRHQELNRWLDVTNHLVSFDGVCAVVDARFGDVLWIGDRTPHLALRQELSENASVLTGLVARSAKRVESDPPASYPVLSHGQVIHVQTDKPLHTFGGASLAVVAIRPHCGDGDAETGSSLSRREHQVSRLLVDGYTIVNAAAILGLTENTVRTYVRRLYRKLGVSTRTDLVRQLHARYA